MRANAPPNTAALKGTATAKSTPDDAEQLRQLMGVDFPTPANGAKTAAVARMAAEKR